MKKWSFLNKFVLIAGLLLASQGFAAWDGVSTEQPRDTVIGGKTFYLIENENQLAWFAAQVNATTKSNANPKSNINAILMADMDLGGHLWTPIAAGKGDTRFSGTIDGKNHKISGLYINGAELAAIHNNAYCNEPRGNQAAAPTCNAQNLGFIGTLGHHQANQPGGTVKNIIFEKVNIQASTNAGDILTNKDSQISVGVVVGWMAENNQNVVDNCIAASGTIRTTGTGQGVGGIVGNAKKGTISNCLSLVEIHTSGAKADVGGIIGITKTNVTVSSCVYAGPGIENTGSNGSVGGVVGNVYSGTATAQNSYFEGNLTYNGNEVGGVGKDCGKKCTVKDTTQKADDTNIEDIACALNGKNADSTCKEEPWSVGLTGLSLNGYGADGYKIIFSTNDGVFADSAVTKNIYLASGMTISDNEVGKPSRDGYSFEGWATTANATEPLENLGTVSKSTKFYAVWALLNTITFDVTPGVFPSGGSSKDKQVANGEVITVEGLGALPESYCSKYDSVHVNDCATTSYFTGWALNPGTSFPDTLDLKDISATDGLVLYAVWDTVETYTVTYNANQHGRTTVDYVRVGAGDTVTTPIDPIADDGYEFDGWFTDAEGENLYDFASKIKESIVLYAKWALQRFDITYVMNEGSANGDNPNSYTIDTSFALVAPTDVDGYVFEGWFYDASFSKPASQVIQGTTGDKTFYAKWSKKTYRIMYLADNNSQGAITDQFKEHGTPFTLASAGSFNRKGYAQTGWATVAEGEKVYELGASYEVEAPLTVYPTWDTAHYVVKYECNDCENNPLNPTTYTMFEKKDLPLKYPQNLEGYDFGGWFKENTYETKTTQIQKGSAGDLTLYGKWIKVYTLTYELNGGTKANSRTSYTSETATFALGEAEGREGYSFAGWYDNEGFTGAPVTEIPLGSTGDKIFYAKWIQEYGAITIVSNFDGTNSAVINGNYGGGDEPNPEEADAVEITSDITVNSVTLDRTFNAGKIATLYVPFEIDAGNVVGTEVYKFKTVVKKEEEGRWKFKVATATKVMPNTPYVIIPEGSQVTFDIATSVSLNTTTAGEPTAANNWEFVGAYQYEKFTLVNDNPIYLFADQARDGAKLGEFVKIADGAYINPMRAYLVYHKSAAMPKSARGNFGSGIALPDELDIEIENENGIVVQTGTLNTVTGEVRMDRWFDLKGRKLNAKPTAKGTYYKNGKRVIIK